MHSPKDFDFGRLCYQANYVDDANPVLGVVGCRVLFAFETLRHFRQWMPLDCLEPVDHLAGRLQSTAFRSCADLILGHLSQQPTLVGKEFGLGSLGYSFAKDILNYSDDQANKRAVADSLCSQVWKVRSTKISVAKIMTLFAAAGAEGTHGSGRRQGLRLLARSLATDVVRKEPSINVHYMLDAIDGKYRINTRPNAYTMGA